MQAWGRQPHASELAMRLSALRAARQLLLKRKAATHAANGHHHHAAGAARGIPETMLKIAAGVAVAVAGTGISLVALLSSPVGLQSLLAVINTKVPGKLEVDDLSLSFASWTQAQLCLHGVKIHEPASLGGHLLFTSRAVNLAGSPWQLITGNPVQVDITGASLNGAYSASGRDFRVVRYLELAGVLEPPPPKGEPAPTESDNSQLLPDGGDVGNTKPAGASATSGADDHQQSHHGSGQEQAQTQQWLSTQQAREQQVHADMPSPKPKDGSSDRDSRQVDPKRAVAQLDDKTEWHQADNSHTGSGQTHTAGGLTQGGQKTGQQQASQKAGQQQGDHKVGQEQDSQKHGQQQDSPSSDDGGVQEDEERMQLEQGGVFMQVLCGADSAVELSGELRQPGLRLTMQDSELRVSSDMRDILGGHVHVMGAFAPEHLGWLHTQHKAPVDATSNTLPASISASGSSSRDSIGAGTSDDAYGSDDALRDDSVSSSHGSDKNRHTVGLTLSEPEPSQKSTGNDTAAQSRWWEDQPLSQEAVSKLDQIVQEHGKECLQPGEWKVVAPNLDFNMRVWEVSVPRHGNQREDSAFTVLHEPAAIALRMTEALGRFGLVAVNPLLGQVSSLSEGSRGAIRGQFIPDGWSLPYTSASMLVEPMCLKLVASPLLTQLINGLKIAGVALPGTPSWLRKTLRSAATSAHEQEHRAEVSHSTEHQDVASGGAAEQHRPRKHHKHKEEKDVGDGATLLEAWLSGFLVRIERDGVIEQKRVDMLLGPSGTREAVQQGGKKAGQALRSTVHLVLWGQADPDTDAIDFTVGLPDDLLHRMGIHQLPDNYCLPVRLLGSMDSPQLDIKPLRARITSLLLRHAAHKRAAAQQRHQDGEHEGPEGAHGEGHGEGQVSSERGAREEHVGGGRGHDHVGPGRKLVRAVKWVWSAALSVFAPSGESLERLDKHLQEEAARVPQQACAVPWNVT